MQENGHEAVLNSLKILNFSQNRSFFPRVARRFALVFAVLAFALLFQGSRGLWERDEGRYTDVAIQMLRGKDYLIPALNDEVSHLTKPPLTYWAIAGSLSVFGRNEWGARLPNALAFTATIFVMLGLSRRITPGRSWLPPVIYATSLLPFTAANFVTTDTLLTLWEALAVLGFAEWWHRGDGFGRFASNLLMWTAFGLAFLTKGPPGLLPLLAIVPFTWLSLGRKGMLRLLRPSGLLMFALVGFGWYAAVAAARPGVLSYWLHDEVVARVASNLHHRNSKWYKPFIIYLPVLGFGCLPWVLPLIRGIRRISRNFFSQSAWVRKFKEDPWAVFLALWFFLPLVVFFISSSRLPLYVLPLALPLALGIGRWVVLPLRGKVEVPLLAAWVVVLLAARFAGSRVPYAMDSRALARAVASEGYSAPAEILFADTEPFWGMSMYLGCEVERVFTTPSVPFGTEPGEPLAMELQHAEPGTLIIVERPKAAKVVETCRKLGYELRPVIEHATWSFIPVAGRGTTE